MNQAPAPPAKLELSRSEGYSALTLAVTALAGLTAGIAIGIGLMLVLGPTAAAPESDAQAETEADESANEDVEAEATASASASEVPTVDAAAQQRFRKLQELRKKVKSQRSKDMDAQCKKHFKTKLPAGYVYQGGRFEENQLVAGASGCAPLATATKAPWFCCPR